MSPKIKSWHRFIAIILLLVLIAPVLMACTCLDVPIERTSKDTSTRNPFEPKPKEPPTKVDSTSEFFTANPRTINQGESSYLSWRWWGGGSDFNLKASEEMGQGMRIVSVVQMSNMWNVKSLEVQPSKTTKYTLTFMKNGEEQEKSVTVEVLGKVEIIYFAPEPDQITQGGTSNLRWITSGSTDIYIHPIYEPAAGRLPLPERGYVPLSPDKTSTYTLEACHVDGALKTCVTSEATIKVSGSIPEPQKAPDLTVTSVSFIPFQPDPDSEETGLKVFFTVKNRGGSPSGLFFNRISLAKTKWGTDYSLGNVEMNSLDPNEDREDKVRIYPIPSGIPRDCYWVTVFTDGFQKIHELEEYNNIGSSDPDIFEVTR